MVIVLVYWMWIVLSLFTFYLVSFKMYDYDYRYDKPGKQIVFPYLIYFLFFLCVFIPLVNIAMPIIFVLSVMIDDSLYVDSILFRHPGEKSKVKDNEGQDK